MVRGAGRKLGTVPEGFCNTLCERAFANTSAEEDELKALQAEPHSYIGHDYMGRNYTGHDYTGHCCTGRSYAARNYTGHSYMGCLI